MRQRSSRKLRQAIQKGGIHIEKMNREQTSSTRTIFLFQIQHKGDNTMNTKAEVNKYRTTATVVGVVYLLGFVVGLLGMGLFTSILSGPDYLSTVSTKST